MGKHVEHDDAIGTQVHIRILPDGRVVFGDLTPALAEVAAVLAPSRSEALIERAAARDAQRDPAGERGAE